MHFFFLFFVGQHVNRDLSIAQHQKKNEAEGHKVNKKYISHAKGKQQLNNNNN